MKPSSCKAKGRVFQQFIRDMFLKWAGPLLQPGDVKTAIMGESGTDIILSPLAQEVFPFHAIECKKVEKLNIWSAMKQAKAHGGKPIVFFSRNREDVYVCLRAEDFFNEL